MSDFEPRPRPSPAATVSPTPPPAPEPEAAAPASPAPGGARVVPPPAALAAVSSMWVDGPSVYAASGLQDEDRSRAPAQARRRAQERQLVPSRPAPTGASLDADVMAIANPATPAPSADTDWHVGSGGPLGGSGLQRRTGLGLITIGSAPDPIADGAGGDDHRREQARQQAQQPAAQDDRRTDPSSPVTPALASVGSHALDAIGHSQIGRGVSHVGSELASGVTHVAQGVAHAVQRIVHPHRRAADSR